MHVISDPLHICDSRVKDTPVNQRETLWRQAERLIFG